MAAKLCDKPKQTERDRWSYAVFGNEWETARVIGTIIRKEGEKFIVKFDVDNSELSCEPMVLMYEAYSTPVQVVGEIGKPESERETTSTMAVDGDEVAVTSLLDDQIVNHDKSLQARHSTESLDIKLKPNLPAVPMEEKVTTISLLNPSSSGKVVGDADVPLQNIIEKCMDQSEVTTYFHLF